MNWADVIRRGRFVVVGRAGMDLYADPPGTRTEDATRFSAALGGSSANIAVALARLGQRVALVSTVSDDAVGRFCLNELDRYGVETTHVRSLRGEMRTSLAVVETRAVDTQSVIYRNNAADFALTGADVAIDLDGVGALILTGTALALEPSREACLALMGRAKLAGVLVVLDIDYRPYSWESQAEAMWIYAVAAALADILIGNDDEFGVLAGGKAGGLPLARDYARTAAFVIYKMGSKGAVTITKDAEFETPVFPVTALKPTGAGDAFMGGLMAGLANALALPDAVTHGAAAAAIVVTRVGCAPAMPTQIELTNFLKAHHAHSAI